MPGVWLYLGNAGALPVRKSGVEQENPERNGADESGFRRETEMSIPKNRLRPCPFCGRDPELAESDGFWHVRCDCGVSTWGHESKAFVRRVWNRRHVPIKNPRRNVKTAGKAL